MLNFLLYNVKLSKGYQALNLKQRKKGAKGLKDLCLLKEMKEKPIDLDVWLKFITPYWLGFGGTPVRLLCFFFGKLNLNQQIFSFKEIVFEANRCSEGKLERNLVINDWKKDF